MATIKLDIKGKELPPDFYDYFNEDGTDKDVPKGYSFGSPESDKWIDRYREIEWSFLTDTQRKQELERRRCWERKVNSSFGAYA